MAETEIKYCGVCGISNETKLVKWCGKMQCNLCSKHYAQLYRNGRITDPTSDTTHDPNKYIIHDDYVEIELYDYETKTVKVGKIDLEDLDRCKPHKWAVSGNYVKARIDKKNTSMHRFLLGYDGELDIDHINRDKLDNRRSNLRIVTRATNLGNNNGKGVWQIDNCKWRAAFVRYGEYHCVGTFLTEEEANAAVDKAKKAIDENEDELARNFEQNIKPNATGISRLPSGRYKASFWRNGKKYNVGTYDTIEEAIEKRNNAKMEAAA